MAIQVLSVGAFSVTVPALSIFNDGPDALTIDGKFYKYQSYNSLTGIFSVVTPNPLQEGVVAGMIISNATLKEKRQQEAFDRLKSYFPKRYNINKTTNLKALLYGLSKGDGYVDYQVEAVRDNLLVMTAQGKYLDRIAGQYGIVRGQGSGVQDSDFRQLVPLLGPSPKQITGILNKIIDVVYGPYASHANITCSLPGPYALNDSWSLNFIVDGTYKEVRFLTEDFINISTATAQEVANIITQKTDGRVIGQVLTNVRTGEEYINVRTATVGSQGFLQVLGGDSQSVMRFPVIRQTVLGIATWNISRVGGTDELSYIVASGVSPSMQNAGVKKGDWVTIRPDSGFVAANCGSFEVTYSDNNEFRVKNESGIPETGVLQLHVDDFTFFQSNTANILLTQRPATIIETAPAELTVILPVTSPLVKRTLKGSHHFHGGITNIIAATSNTVTIGSNLGFKDLNGAFQPSGRRDTSTGVVSSIGATTITLINSSGWLTSGSLWSEIDNQFYYYNGITGNQLQSVTPPPPSTIVNGLCKYVNRYKYSTIIGNLISGVFPNPSSLVNQEITNGSSELFDQYPGSFIYDTSAPFSASSESTIINEQIDQGSARTVIKVGDVSAWPNSGYVIFKFNKNGEEGPVRYQAKVGSNGLVLDPGHVFENTHRTGSSIRLIRNIGTYIPRTTGKDYAIYLTSTSPARDLIASYLRQIAASGVKIRFEIRSPEQKWAVLPNLYTTLPLDTDLVPPQ